MDVDDGGVGDGDEHEDGFSCVFNSDSEVMVFDDARAVDIGVVGQRSKQVSQLDEGIVVTVPSMADESHL